MSTAKDRYRRVTRACKRCGGLGHTNHGSPTDIIFILGPKAPKCERCGGSGIEPAARLNLSLGRDDPADVADFQRRDREIRE